MVSSLALLTKRRFAPLLGTLFLGAFNDNLYRTSMVLIVIYGIYADPAQEATFSALAAGVFILPFFLFSALAGQLADSRDKAAIVRRVKDAEIGIMALGALALTIGSIPLMLAVLFATGLQSTLFGPIKYALLPQHLDPHEVLGGTGMVEAATYVAILVGIVIGGLVITADAGGSLSAGWGAFAVVLTAVLGRMFAQSIPTAPPAPEEQSKPIDWNFVSSTIALVGEVMKQRTIRLAIWCISAFWAMGTMLAAIFPPLVKNELGADAGVATLFLASFSVGVAFGSLAINRLLSGRVSARFAAAAALLMAMIMIDFFRRAAGFETGHVGVMPVDQFVAHPGGIAILIDLFLIAAFGGAYVVPLYAFLTTHVAPGHTARAVAANNVVNSGFMVASSLALTMSYGWGVGINESVWIVILLAIVSAALGWRLYRADDG